MARANFRLLLTNIRLSSARLIRRLSLAGARCGRVRELLLYSYDIGADTGVPSLERDKPQSIPWASGPARTPEVQPNEVAVRFGRWRSQSRVQTLWQTANNRT